MQPPTPNPKADKKGCFGLLAIVVIIALLAGLFSNKKNDKFGKEDRTNMAFIISKGIVKNFLKAPATADFPFADFRSKRIGDNTYIISSYVDSQNSFGANIRTNWTTKLQYIGGDDADPANWNLLDIQTMP